MWQATTAMPQSRHTLPMIFRQGVSPGQTSRSSPRGNRTPNPLSTNYVVAIRDRHCSSVINTRVDVAGGHQADVRRSPLVRSRDSALLSGSFPGQRTIDCHGPATSRSRHQRQREDVSHPRWVASADDVSRLRRRYARDPAPRPDEGEGRAGSRRGRAGSRPLRQRCGDQADMRVVALADAWFREVSAGDRSPSTLVQYRYRLDRQIIPALGEFRVRELTPGTIDRHLTAVTAKHGAAAARTVRSVLSGMAGLAARNDALDRNPVRDAGRIKNGRQKAPTALSGAQARQLLALLTYDDRAISRDLVDLVAFMLATGARIGEACALSLVRCGLRSSTRLDHGYRRSPPGQGVGHLVDQDDDQQPSPSTAGVDCRDAARPSSGGGQERSGRCGACVPRAAGRFARPVEHPISPP